MEAATIDNNAAPTQQSKVKPEILPSSFVLFIFLLILSLQFAIQFWKKVHRKSYVLTTFLLMWILPISFVILLNPWVLYIRMILIWSIYSAITVWIFKLSFARNLARNTPKKVYAWFLLVYKLSHLSTMFGVCTMLIELLSYGQFYQWFQHVALRNVSVLTFLCPPPYVWLFYGLYYGVLVRDCAEMCADAMSNSMTRDRNQYYLSPSVMEHTCGICSLPLKAESKIGQNNGRELVANSHSDNSAARTGMGMGMDGGRQMSTNPLSEYLDEENGIDDVESGVGSGDRSYRGDGEDVTMSTSSLGGGGATSQVGHRTTTSQPTKKLNCGHKFHEFCLRGWMIVGKKDVCPFCNEKIEFSREEDSKQVTRQPWKSDSQVYIQILELVRYLLVWNPIIVLAIHLVFVIYFYVHKF